MVVNNIIWGERYLMWTGNVEIVCPESGYHAHIELKEVSHRNLVWGKITKRNSNNNYSPEKSTFTSTTTSSTTTTTTTTTTISTETSDFPEFGYEISGVAGGKVYIYPSQSPDATFDISGDEDGSADKKLLFNMEDYTDNHIEYLPEEVQTELNSLKLWQPVKRAIIINDMNLADGEKKKVEQDQRRREAQRRATNTSKKGTYFTFNSTDPSKSETSFSEDPDEDGDVVNLDQGGHWAFLNNIVIDANYLKKIEEEVAKVREARSTETPPEPSPSDTDFDINTIPDGDDPQDSNNGDCTIS